MMGKDYDDTSFWTDQKKRINSIFYDRKVVLTGELLQVARQDASMFVLKLGGHVVAAVSEHTDIVVVGDNPDLHIMELVTKMNQYCKYPQNSDSL